MDKRDARRIKPIANVTLVLVVILVVFELLIIFGAMGLKARTVAKYAPWAYEPFLRLVGEHPESAPRLAAEEEADGDNTSESSVAVVAGLQPSAIPVLTETDTILPGTNVAIVAEEPDAPETEPADVSTNNPPAKKEAIAPVG